MIAPADVVWYFAHEVEGLKETDLVCAINGDEVALRPAHWLDDTWAEIMDYVEAMDGEWVKNGKQSHWVFDVDRIESRVTDERWIEVNRPLQEWWLQQPDAEKARLIPLWKDTDKWRALSRDERIAMVRDCMKPRPKEASP